MKRNLFLLAPASLVGALVSACAMGPNYTRPTIEIRSAYRGADPDGPPETQSLAAVEWTELFGDAALRRILTKALNENFDLKIAAERVLQARARFRIFFPRIGLTAFFGAQSRALSDLLSAPARMLTASMGTPVTVRQLTPRGPDR